MDPRETDPADETGSDKRPPHVPEAGSNDALRKTIERIMDDGGDGRPAGDSERLARVAALRKAIQSGDYVSEERIAEIVDRLMKQWDL